MSLRIRLGLGMSELGLCLRAARQGGRPFMCRKFGIVSLWMMELPSQAFFSTLGAQEGCHHPSFRVHEVHLPFGMS